MKFWSDSIQFLNQKSFQFDEREQYEENENASDFVEYVRSVRMVNEVE